MPKQDTVQIITEVVKDSLVMLPADSAVIKAWFECDSLNQVIMTKLEAQEGEHIQPYTSFNSGQLNMTAKVDSQGVYLAWKERHDSTHVTRVEVKEVQVDKIVYRKPVWLKVLAGLGVGAVVQLLLLILKKIK